MDAGSLTRLVTQLSGDFPPVGEPEALLAALEAAADAAPGDGGLSRAVRAVHERVTAGDGLKPVVAGVRREVLVRWDADSTTWEGPRADRSERARVRVLRPRAAKAPVLRRALLRDGRALSGVVDGLVEHDGSLVAPVPGPALDQSGVVARGEPRLLARALGRALADAKRWHDAGVQLPRLQASDLRETADGVRILCLTPGDGQGVVEDLAGFHQAWWGEGGDSDIEAMVAGLVAFPPETLDEAIARFREALVSDLAGQRHDLFIRWQERARLDQRTRLKDTLAALVAAVPHPHGRGAVGVDLEGQTNLLLGHEGGLWWGPAAGTLKRVWAPEGGFEAREARRMLRARASSPPNPRLDAEVEGDAVFTEHACRWVAAGLRLRTLSLLLDKTSAASDEPWPVGSS